MAAYDPDLVLQNQASERFSAIIRSGLEVSEIATWDPDLLREPRVLVPIDVQALVMAPGDATLFVEVKGPLSPGVAPDDASVLDAPAPFGPGAVRPAGVHLHWAMPDALMRGTLQDPRGQAAGGLGLPVLPDRWGVLRLLAPVDGLTAHVRGWVIDAANATVTDLAGQSAALPAARSLASDALTGTAGGSLTWTAGYDASYARFAWHDPLDDLAADSTLGGALPGGPAGAAATYLVVGWWSVPEHDPLDDIRSNGGLAERTEALGWRVARGGGGEAQQRSGPLSRAAQLGLSVATRLTPGVQQALERARIASSSSSTRDDLDIESITSTVDAYRAIAATGLAKGAGKWISGRGVGAEASTLLHGAIVGVPLPVAGGAASTDLRPDPTAVRVTFGETVDDLVAAGVSASLGAASGDERRALERLLAAFTSGLLGSLASPDGVVDVDEREHASGFASVAPDPAVEPPVVDRVRTGRAGVPSRPTRQQASSGTKDRPLVFIEAKVGRYLQVESSEMTVSKLTAYQERNASGPSMSTPPAPEPPAPAVPGDALVERPAAPRWFPLDPLIAVGGAGRSLRHGGDGRGDADERLACRRPSQIGQQYHGLVRGADILPSLGSGALPVETVDLAREALLLSPHLAQWLAEVAAAANPAVDRRSAERRIGAELALRYSTDGGYFGKAEPGATIARGDVDPKRLHVVEELRKHSMFDGVEPDLVGITSWAQPWVPMWLEWQVDVTPADDLTGWTLGAVDLGAAANPAAPAAAVMVTGRSPLTTAPGSALSGAVAEWLTAEDARDAEHQGEVDDATALRLAALAKLAAGLDLVGASLDGVRTALLGLPRASVRPRDASGAAIPPTPVAPPELLIAGPIRLSAARLVDAFGRTLDLPLADTRVPARIEIGGSPAALRRTPRFLPPTRCQLRLVGADSSDAGRASDAIVDEIDAAHQVSPVVGFLLPDHVDESIEVFGCDGGPLGELLVEPIGGGVIWEPAPGRPVPADAPPGSGLTASQRVLGMLASGMVSADANARTGLPADVAALPPSVRESALSAFLRAVDTTLWTSDPVAGAGSSGLASIVGRPVAVVRAVIEIDVADDLDDLTLDTTARAERAAAFSELAGVEVRVRIGELSRQDDGVLGWFADDDYSHFHVVDKAVRDLALEAGRRKGFLGEWGTTPAIPTGEEILHPYLLGEDELLVRPGVPRLVTILMLPGSRAHVTCGVVPRQSVGLSRAWFAPGLEKISPSVRVGPVLVDPGDVRLPNLAALGEKQVLTTRDGALSWRDDAILAATQAALLPDRASVLREGWIRVDPNPGTTT